MRLGPCYKAQSFPSTSFTHHASFETVDVLDDADRATSKHEVVGHGGANRSRVSIEAHDVGVEGVTRDDGRVGFPVVGTATVAA